MPCLHAAAVARVLERFVLEPRRIQTQPASRLQQRDPIRRDQVSHPLAAQHERVKPEPAVQGVGHAVLPPCEHLPSHAGGP
jgi:hypothetical protein